MAACFPKSPRDSDDDGENLHKAPPPRAAVTPANQRNAQYEAVLKNIQSHDLKDFHQLRLMAFRRRSLLKKPGLKENLRLWLSIEVGELASFTEQDLKRVVSENVQQTTPDGESVVHLAAQKGNNQILKLAIKAIPRANRAAFINARSMVNEAPLLLAAQNGHREAVRTLLHAGADVNCTNTSGETALYLACYHGYREVALELVRHPLVDVDRLSEESASAYGVSLIRRHLDIARLIRWRSLWPVFRQLWLARRKNAAPACPLAALPDSFIKSVISVLVSSEVAQLSAVKKP